MLMIYLLNASEQIAKTVYQKALEKKCNFNFVSIYRTKF